MGQTDAKTATGRSLKESRGDVFCQTLEDLEFRLHLLDLMKSMGMHGEKGLRRSGHRELVSELNLEVLLERYVIK